MYNGYPVVTCTQGLLITRTYLDPDKSGRDDPCTEIVTIDPDYAIAVETPTKTEIKTDPVKWYSAREMREQSDYREWCTALCEG